MKLEDFFFNMNCSQYFHFKYIDIGHLVQINFYF